MKPGMDDVVAVDFKLEAVPGLNLRRTGVWRHIEDPRFAVLGVAVAAGEAQTGFYWEGAARAVDSLEAARALLADHCRVGSVLAAHDLGLAAAILDHRWGLRFAWMFDTAGYARALGLDASLANMAAWMGFEPAPPQSFDRASLSIPDRLALFARHTMKNVALCREILRRAIHDASYPGVEFDIVAHTAQLNLSGIGVDKQRVARYLATLRARRDRELEVFASTYPFDTSHLNRTPKVKEFVRTRFGVTLPRLDRRQAAVLDVLARGGPAAQFLLARARIQRLSKAIAKAEALAEAPARVRNFIRYFGAHTGRFSAGGRDSHKLNVHQMGKESVELNLPELAMERTVLVPPEGKLFAAADLSSIEARVVAWFAGEHELLQRFRCRQGDDVYVWFVKRIFPGIEMVKNALNWHLRALGKEAVLGLGFGMGLEKFISQARRRVPECSEADVERAFRVYRDSFRLITSLRYDLFRAFRRARAGRLTVRPLWAIHGIDDPAGGPTVAVDLPTGRRMYYRSVRITQESGPWGMHTALWYAPAYGGERAGGPARIHGRTASFPDGRGRAQVTASSLVENVVQAVARDVLVHQVLELERRGYKSAFHAHDEIVLECEDCGCSGACSESCGWTAAGRALIEVMGAVPPSLPRLRDLPVACEVSRVVKDTYAK